MFGQAIQDFYRYPKGMLDLAPRGQFSRPPGFFRFGADVVYGRSSASEAQQKPDATLEDLAGAVSIAGATLRLPFDPSEVLDNLRFERYPHRGLQGANGILKGLYYLLRPLTSRSVRSRIQRLHVSRSDQLPFPKWPLDTTVENVCESILLLLLEAKVIDSLPFVWFWPRGNRACTVMTHDVETTEGMQFCREMLDLNDAYGIRASFDIVPEERYPVSAEMLQEIRRRGSEIVVQDLNHDGRLFDEKQEFSRRAARIREYAAAYGSRGFRSAVLYRNPEWCDELGFSFDMSVPNVAHLDPQIGGCCTVLPYFIGKTLELPVTTTQDYSLFYLLKERSIDLWRRQVEAILEKSGMATFIVHPDYVIERENRRVYEDLLGYLRQLRQSRQIWFALPGEVDTWWRARSRMSVVKSGSGWRIEGEGSENAALAFARCIDGKLTYQLANAAAKA